MSFRIRYIFIMFIVCTLSFAGISQRHAQAVPLSSIVYADIGLQSCVQVAVDAALPTVLTDSGQITALNCAGLGISSLEGLQAFTNLSELDASRNMINDLAPLAGLAALTRVRLDDNAIVDISPITSLVNLRSIDLSDNAIATFPVMTGLTSLTALIMPGNQVGDLTPLASLQNLSALDLSGNLVQATLYTS